MKKDRGGFAMGLIVGLLVGLALALGVALYVTKAPVPFVNKVQQRSADQDAAEAEKLKHWDPNAPLAGKPASKPAPSAAPAPGSEDSSTATAPPAPALPPPSPSRQAASAVAGGPAAAASRPERAKPARDPAAILAGQPVPDPPAARPAPKPDAESDTSTAMARSTKPGADPFVYFVQSGAYSREEDAEAARAKLAMQGFAAKITEREQSGRPVYRVRLGPYDFKDDAESYQNKLQAAGSEAAIVRIFKQ